MTDGGILRLAGILWLVFGVYWLAAALRSKAPHSSEATPYRYLRLVLLLITFELIFSPRAAIGLLGRRFLPPIPALAYCGFVLTLAGLALAVWARKHLAHFWSDIVGLQSEHRLIRSGPYTYIRHPIYSGVLLAIAGTVLVLGEWRGILAFVIQLTNWTVKARKEERFLAARFGPEFQLHAKRTGFLLPRLRTNA